MCSWPVVRSQTAVHGAADLCRGESSGCGEQRGQDWAHRSVRVAGGAIADCDGTREMKGCCARESSDGRSRRHEDCSGMRPVSARLPRGRARRQGAGHCKVCRRCAVAVCGSTRQQQRRCAREISGGGEPAVRTGWRASVSVSAAERQSERRGGRALQSVPAACCRGVWQHEAAAETLCRRDQRRQRAGREDWLEGQCLCLGCREAEREERGPGTAKCAGDVLSRCVAARGSRDAVFEGAAAAGSQP